MEIITTTTDKPREAGLCAALLEASCDWAFIVDAEMVIRHSHKSRSAKQIVLVENTIGKSFFDLFPEETRRQFQGKLQPEHILPGKGLMTSFNDSLFGLHFIKAVLVDENNPGAGIALSVWQVDEELSRLVAEHRSDQAGAERASAARRCNEQQKLIADLSLEFTQNRDLDHLFNYVVGKLGNLLGVDRCAVFRHDECTQTFGMVYEWTAPDCASVKKQVQGVPYPGETYREFLTRPYLAVADTFADDNPTYAYQRQSGVHAFVDVPLMVEGQFWGFLGADYHQAPHQWTAEEFGMLQAIAKIMASALSEHILKNEHHDTYMMLREMVGNYPGIIWAVDKENHITFMEGCALTSLKINPQEITGMEFDDLFRMRANDENLAIFKRTLTHGSQHFYFNSMGHHFTCQTAQLFDREGELSGAFGVALDVTEMRQVQDKLREAIRRAESANLAKSEFLSRMSHEIRTPMNAILGMNELAKKTDEVERLKYYLEKIEGASTQLLGLINDILELSRIESGKMEINNAPFEYEKLLQNVYTVIQPKIEEKQLEFIFDVEGVEHREMVSDELRLSQVVINLLSNAAKFTPEKGNITLTSRVYEDRGETWLRVEVKDTGIGISKESQQKLFDTFSQADGSIAKNYGGSGLGLSICKKIVTLMGGEIGVDSVLGQGTRFIFEVPVTFNEAKVYKSRILPNLTGLRALVVDDSQEVLDYVKRIVTGYRMVCDTAPSPKEAMALVETALMSAEAYDVILIDGEIEADGDLTWVATLKKLMPEAVPIMMSGAADLAAVKARGEAAGIEFYLAKPLLPSLIYNTIIAAKGGQTLPQDKKSETPSGYWPGKTILVAEDIGINQEILASLLEATHVQLVFVENGRQALELYHARSDEIDLILMDIQMPELNGYEATRHIRELEGLGDAPVPIIAMTADAFAEDVQRCLDAGMNDHLAKPINVGRLMEVLALYLNTEASRQAARLSS